MRAREKTLEDYGISKEESEKLYEKCRNLSEIEEDMLFKACRECCDTVLATKIFVSLTQGKSYDTLLSEEYIPIGRDDFYAYRRKTLAEFYKFAKEAE